MKFLGGILLIIGTSIGGGMLALPLATASIGFVESSLLLVACWFVMTAGAFLILEVNLWLPTNSNLISMAKATLGKGGQAVAWVTCLLLLYSLLAAYIAGGSDFLKSLLSLVHVTLPNWSVTLLFTTILGGVVFMGIHAVDHTNRILIFVKFGALILLMGFMFPQVSLSYLSGGESKYLMAGITVSLTSFGFATIVPSMRAYFHNDVKKLRLAILMGSLIPLVCYIVWNFAVMGVIPRTGDQGLVAILHSKQSTSDFVNVLSALLHRDTITNFARTFTSVCLLTSFLGVALSLSDFLADGLHIEKVGMQKLFILVLTFVPPVIVVLVYPGAFITALAYAGIYCVILLILLPTLMVWFGRYRKNIAKGYQVAGGKFLLVFLMIVSVFIIGQSIISVIN